MKVWVTGDFHRGINDLQYRCELYDIKPGDLVIVAGDDCLNIFGGINDQILKKRIDDWGIDFLFVNGNHQNKPENISSYSRYEWGGGYILKENFIDNGKVTMEDIFPHLHFAIDGEIYNIAGKTIAVCGGAYSVDKYIRSYQGACSFPYLSKEEFLLLYNVAANEIVPTKEQLKQVDKIALKVPSYASCWWPDEQPSAATKRLFENNLDNHMWNVDIVITHTAPLRFEPTERFLKFINQDMVDKKTERWLNKIEKKLTYKMWYAGHYHTNKTVNNSFQFLYDGVVPLGEQLKSIV